MHEKHNSDNKMKTGTCIFFLILGIDFTTDASPSV